MDNPLLSASERPACNVPVCVSRVIEAMGITSVTFWRWEKAGIIQTVRIAGRKYVMPDALNQFTARAMAGELSGKARRIPGAR